MNASRTLPRRLRRPMLVLAGTAALATPAVALATSVNAKIADGFWSTISGVKGVPTGEDVEFTLNGHASIRPLVLVCQPNATIAPMTEDSGYADIFIKPDVRSLALKNGNFSYDGPAEVTDGDPRRNYVATTLDIHGYYQPHGKTYHFTGTIQNAVTATLTFAGRASSPACTGLPKGNEFYLYRALSTGGE